MGTMGSPQQPSCKFVLPPCMQGGTCILTCRCQQQSIVQHLLLQVKHNVQRTLAIELQRLSVQFRKQQKAYLSRLRQKDAPSASGASFSVLDETSGTSGREAIDPDYDPGFNEIQVCPHELLSQAGCCRTHASMQRALCSLRSAVSAKAAVAMLAGPL